MIGELSKYDFNLSLVYFNYNVICLFFYAAAKNPDIQHIHADAVKFLSFAVESRIKELLEKLSSVVSHRMINFKVHAS